MVKEIR